MAINSLERLVDTLYLPAEYPGQQRFLCVSEEETHLARLAGILVRRLAERVPARTMDVCFLQGLDWSSREALTASLVQAMEQCASSLCARIPKRPNGVPPHRADLRLRWLMDPPDDVPENVLTFVMTIPSDALRPEMRDGFFQLGALISSSDHNWVIVTTPKITSFGVQEIALRSPFYSFFEVYELAFSLADLPDETTSCEPTKQKGV